MAEGIFEVLPEESIILGYEPEDVLTHFLRVHLPELTRTSPSFANRQISASETFAGDGGSVVFTLAFAPVCITSVTVDATEVFIYKDFNIDLDRWIIKFRTAPTEDSVVVINYAKGNTWVYPDKPRDKLSIKSYPRIAVVPITESETFKTLGDTRTYNSVTLQFDIISPKDLLCTIGTESAEGQDITTYLARQLINVVKTKWRSYLSYRIKTFSVDQNSPVPFDESKNIFRRIVVMSFVFDNNEELVL